MYIQPIGVCGIIEWFWPFGFILLFVVMELFEQTLNIYETILVAYKRPRHWAQRESWRASRLRSKSCAQHGGHTEAEG